MRVPRGSTLTLCDGANLSVDSLYVDDGSSLIIEHSQLVTSEKWKTGDGDIQFLSTIVSLEYRGDNIIAWSTAKITDTTGWQRGDIIYNVGTDTSWSMQIIK